MQWVGHVACVGKLRKHYKISVVEFEEKKPLRRHRKEMGG
jgi:hypothetical protein